MQAKTTATVSQRYSFFTAGDDFKLMKARPNYSKVRIKGWDRTTLSHSVVMDARSWIDSSKAVWVVLRRQLSFLHFWLNKRMVTKKMFLSLQTSPSLIIARHPRASLSTDIFTGPRTSSVSFSGVCLQDGRWRGGRAGESRCARIQINPLNNKKANEPAAAGQTHSFICIT